MNTKIVGKSFTVSEAIEDRVNKKLAKLDKYFGDDAQANVKLSLERGRQIVEATISYRGDILRAEESTSDLYSSLDGVIDKLQRQVSRHRARFEKRMGAEVFSQLDQEVVELPVQYNIVRTKRFTVDAMSPDEAIAQMDLLGHSFFIFRNEQDGKLCVVYQRDDGDYGLLIPETED